MKALVSMLSVAFWLGVGTGIVIVRALQTLTGLR